jgi:polyisoprenoid-binding protein YceI
MKKLGMRRTAVSGGALVALGVLLSASGAHRPPQAPQSVASTSHEMLFVLDPSESKLHWTLGSSLHTVHGNFALKRGSLRLDPENGKASGEIVADATSAETGNEGRDRKMHKEILESPRYTEIIFRPDRVEGRIAAQGTSDVKIHGIFGLHGSEHELTVPVHAEATGDHWTGKAQFSVPYVEWGLKSPNTFLLKADKAVQIDLAIKGKVQKAKTE